MRSHDDHRITDQLPAFIFSFTFSGLVRSMNAPLLASLGYASQEVIGVKRFPDLLAPGGKIFYDTHVYPLIRMQGGFNELSLSVSTKNGGVVPLLLNAHITQDAGEGLICCVGIRVDNRNRYEREILEARRQAEEALRDNEHLRQLRSELEQHREALEKRLQHLALQNAELKQINAVLSHDMQEPLRKICLFSQMLQAESLVLAHPRWGKHLGKIGQAAESMRDMITSLREFIEVGEFEPEPSMLRLTEVFAEAKQITAEAFEGMQAHMACADAPVYGDQALLIRLFCELLSNSAGFRDRSKPVLEVTVHADLVDENVFRETGDRYRYRKYTRIRYSDNGMGFPSRFHEDVFKLFRKAHLYGQGLGVGLPVCRKIVTMHHGTITARSQQGEGTFFTILLPTGPVEEDPGTDSELKQAEQQTISDAVHGSRIFSEYQK